MGKFVVKDSFYNKAKKEGFRARSAYKLKEIQDKYHLIKKGDKVLDLGCAPGSFLQVLSGIVGDNGLAFGIDILPTPKLLPKILQPYRPTSARSISKIFFPSCLLPHLILPPVTSPPISPASGTLIMPTLKTLPMLS